VLLAPALLAFELAVLATAAAQGWLSSKLAGYRWLWSHRRHIRERRRHVQGARRVPDAELVPLLSAQVVPPNVELPRGAALANTALSAYWHVVRRWV
jgi:hypothetical protein